MMHLPLTPFYFIRHGETDWNKRRIYMGQKDIPLNNTGILQAQEAAKVLQHEPIKHIISSPLSRAKTTAEIINRTLKLNITVIEELQERAWGLYEGKPVQDGLLDKCLDGKTCTLVEPFHVFEQRILKGFLKIFAFAPPVLIVAHSGSYVALQRYLKASLTRPGNCVPLYHRPPEREGLPWFICSLAPDVDGYDDQ